MMNDKSLLTDIVYRIAYTAFKSGEKKEDFLVALNEINQALLLLAYQQADIKDLKELIILESKNRKLEPEVAKIVKVTMEFHKIIADLYRAGGYKR